MVEAWYDEITDEGFSIFGWCIGGHCGDAYSRDGRSVNGSIANSWFADASVVSWGNDTPRLDDGDAVMIGTHGADSADVWSGTMRVNEAGPGNCTLRRDEMEIGDSDLEFLHLSSCNSMDANQWSSWWRAFNRAHQVDGFHGFMWIGSGRIPNYRNFASDAFDGAPNGAQVFRTKGSVLRFRPEQGELRYESRARAVDLLNDVGELPSPEETEQVALRVLTRFGLPRDEFVNTEVVTQIAAGGSIESREVEVRREMYRLVAVSRRLGELPVFVSDVRAAVTPEGQIQRLRINWPPLSLESEMRVVAAEYVVERAVEVLVDRDTSAEAEMRARLGYLPQDEKDPTVVLPVVLFTVLDPPTPFVFAVPVVEPSEGDDQ